MITRHRFQAEDLVAVPAVVAVRSSTSDLHGLVAERLSELLGRPVGMVPGADDHEIYLYRPEVLTEAISCRS